MIYLHHSFWTGVMVAGLLWSGEHPATLFFAYLLNYLYRVVTLWGVSAAADRPGGQVLAAFLTRKPLPTDPNQPMREGNAAGPPAKPWAYFFLLLFLGYVGFILAHSIDTEHLDIGFRDSLNELGAAAWLALIWYAQDVAGKAMILDPGKPLSFNLGYNSKETVILSMAVLTGAGLLVLGEGLTGHRNPWWVVGSLLFYRWVWGVWEDKKTKISNL